MGRSLQEREDYVQGCFDQVTGGQGGYRRRNRSTEEGWHRWLRCTPARDSMLLIILWRGRFFSALAEMMKELEKRKVDL